MIYKKFFFLIFFNSDAFRPVYEKMFYFETTFDLCIINVIGVTSVCFFFFLLFNFISNVDLINMPNKFNLFNLLF
jgi:hypothetical protein